MSDSDLIKALESFKENNYTVDDFINFIFGVPKLKKLSENRANDFINYLETKPDLIKRFVDDIEIRIEQYTLEESIIINDILNRRLQLFYVIYCLYNREDLVDTTNDIFRNLAIGFLMDNDDKFELIDYIVKFGIISNIDIIKPRENKTILNDEEIEILKLRKHLTKNSLFDIAKSLDIKAGESSVKQKSYVLRNKLGANTIDEAIRIFEEKYYKL